MMETISGEYERGGGRLTVGFGEGLVTRPMTR